MRFSDTVWDVAAAQTRRPHSAWLTKNLYADPFTPTGVALTQISPYISSTRTTVSTRRKLHGTRGKRSPKTLEDCEREARIACEHFIFLIRLMNPLVKVLLKCVFRFFFFFRWYTFPNFCTQILSSGGPTSSKASATAAPNRLQRDAWRDVVRIGSRIIFHRSKLWKTKFFILCVVIFLVRLQGKFEIDHR